HGDRSAPSRALRSCPTRRSSDLETVSLSRELVEEWGVLRMNESEINRYNRIQGVRLFASFLCKVGYPSHIAALPRLRSTFTPYIFTDKQISAFFRACDRLDAFAPNCCTALIIPVLFRLLYATGLRNRRSVGIDL